MLTAKCVAILKSYHSVVVARKGDANLDHVQTMIPKAISFFEEGRREKGFRWLGFIQGVFWTEGVFTIDEMKNHNRPDSGTENKEEE